MKSKSGFTLIEILIALAIFAILATLTSSAMYQAFNTRARVAKQAERLVTLQLAIAIIERESAQVIDRAIRGNEMHIFPAFTGQNNVVEFTRSGNINPLYEEKRSNLKRVAFLCRQQQLIQRSWKVLDPINREQFEEKVLLDNLSKCQFAFLNENLQVLNEWRANTMQQAANSSSVPKAIQLNLSLADWGDLSLLFPLPKGLYNFTSEGEHEQG